MKSKMLTRILGAFAAFSMAAGVGVAIGANGSEVVPVHAAGTKIDIDLTTDDTTSASDDALVWNKSYFTVTASKETGTKVTNYWPGTGASHTRLYNNNKITFSPASNYQIDVISITATSSSYLKVGTTATSTNATISTSGAVATVTPTDGTEDVVLTLNGTGRYTQISVTYSTASVATLSSIALSGSMTETDYTTADAWDPTGLVVTGTYSDSTTKNLTAGSTFTYYNSSDVEVATPKALGVGTNQTLKVVASYTGVSDTAKYVASTAINVTKVIQYELVTDPSKLTKGTTFMFVGSTTVSGTTYTRAMQQSRTTSNSASGAADVTLSNGFNSGSVAVSANATIFTLGGSAGAWTITNGDNQLGFTGTSNNNMQFNEDQTDTFRITTQSGYLLSVDSNTQSGRKLQYNPNVQKGVASPRFSNYSGGQTYLYMFANISEVSYGTTDHISISSLPETEFAVGETFSSSGISVIAWDGADESTANSKIVESYTTSFDDVTFVNSHIGQQIVSITYSESGNDFTTSYNIYVYASVTYELVTEAPSDGWAGSYLITYTVSGSSSQTVSDGTYAMKSTLDNFDVLGNYKAVTTVTTEGVKTITTGQYLQFSIAAVDGGYSIQGQNGKYIGWGSSTTNGLTTSNSPLVNTISIDGDDVTILCSEGVRGLTLSTSSGQFRYYQNATVQLYKLVQSSAAVTYAETFLNDLGSVCKANGNSDLADLQLAWASLALDFDTSLSGNDKLLFTQGTADQSGDAIGRALALYDYIAGKYQEDLESEDCDNYDFMGREPQPLAQGKIVNIIESSEDKTMIGVIGALTIATIAAFSVITLRKRKSI